MEGGTPVSEFRYRRRVQFAETDLVGVVHFSWIARYMEEAEHALWREAGLSVHEPGSDIGWPRVAASFEYQSALTFEQEFEVWLRIAEIKRKTIRYACEVTHGDRKVGTGAMTIACVQRTPNQPMRAIEIPADIAARFQVSPDAER